MGSQMHEMSEQPHIINTASEPFFPGRNSATPSAVKIPERISEHEDEEVLNDMSNMTLNSNRGRKRQQRQGRIEGLKAIGINVIGNDE